MKWSFYKACLGQSLSYGTGWYNYLFAKLSCANLRTSSLNKVMQSPAGPRFFCADAKITPKS